MLNVLAPLLDRRRPTVDGRTIGEDRGRTRPPRRCAAPARCPNTAQGGIAVLRGNLAPDGAVVKQRRGPGHAPPHRPGARLRVGRRGAGFADVARDQPRRRAGDPQRGPAGGPGMREAQHPRPMPVGIGLGETVAMITDDRRYRPRPRAMYRPRLPRGVRRRADRRGAGEGDLIEIDIPNRRLMLHVPDDEIARLLAEWSPRLRAVTKASWACTAARCRRPTAGAVLAVIARTLSEHRKTRILSP